MTVATQNLPPAPSNDPADDLVDKTQVSYTEALQRTGTEVPSVAEFTADAIQARIAGRQARERDHLVIQQRQGVAGRLLSSDEIAIQRPIYRAGREAAEKDVADHRASRNDQ